MSRRNFSVAEQFIGLYQTDSQSLVKIIWEPWNIKGASAQIPEGKRWTTGGFPRASREPHDVFSGCVFDLFAAAGG